jgi:hypothetical protein
MGSYVAGSFNPQTRGYDLAISESPRPFITLVRAVTYLTYDADTEYPIPSGGRPGSITPCQLQGGEFCFAEPGAIGIISRTGSIKEIRTPTPGAIVGGVAQDIDRAEVWFTEPLSGMVGKIDSAGIYEYPTNIPGSQITNLTYAREVGNFGFETGFTFTDPGTNSVGGFKVPYNSSVEPTLVETSLPTTNAVSNVIGGLFFGESNVARYGYLGSTSNGVPVVADFPSDGIVTSIAQGDNVQWATTTKNTLEEIEVPVGEAPPGPILSTHAPGFTNLRDLFWMGDGGVLGPVLFLAGDSSGAAIVEVL